MKIVRIITVFIFLSSVLVISCKNKSGQTEVNPILNEPAVKGITEQIHDDPTNASLYFRRGNILHKMAIDTLAINDYKKATKLDSTKAEYFSAVGNILFDHKDVSGSVEWFEKAIKLDPKDPLSHLKMAKLFYMLKDYTKAMEQVKITLDQNRYNAEGYFILGMVYKDKGDTMRSINSFLSAIQADPKYKEAMIQAGQLYATKNDTVAMLYYNNAFKIDTTDVMPLYARGMYWQDHKSYERAKQEYKNCILRDNQYAAAYFSMGWILMQQDSLEKALRQFDLVTKIEPNAADAYYNRGLCNEEMKKKQEAINDYKQALIFDPKYQKAKIGLQRLGIKQ